MLTSSVPHTPLLIATFPFLPKHTFVTLSTAKDDYETTLLSAGGVSTVYNSIPCATAQDISQCNASLYKSTEYVRDNEAARLSWAYTMSRNSFDEVKHDVQSGLTVPIKGIPVSGNLDYSDFHSSAERDFKQANSDYSFDRARAYLKSYLSSESASSYAKAEKIQLQIKGAGGTVLGFGSLGFAANRIGRCLKSRVNRGY